MSNSGARAGRQSVSRLPQTSCLDSATGFAMIRGAHIDLEFRVVRQWVPA